MIYELSLFVAVEHFELNARAGMHFVKKTSLILRLSHRRRGICVDVADVVGVAKTSEHFERLYRLRYPCVLQRPVYLHILRQTHRLLYVVDNLKIPSFQYVDQY